MVFLTNQQGELASISWKSWLFLILSGLATVASWLCYYKALQMGQVSKVVPIDKLSLVITLLLAAISFAARFFFLSRQGLSPHQSAHARTGTPAAASSRRSWSTSSRKMIPFIPANTPASTFCGRSSMKRHSSGFRAYSRNRVW